MDSTELHSESKLCTLIPLERTALPLRRKQPSIDIVIDAPESVSRQADYSRIVLNFPPDLAEQVRELAERERRPITRQIQVMVEHALRMMQAAA